MHTRMTRDDLAAIAEKYDTELYHYGMPRRSGRYPWGSGKDPYQHGSRDFLGRVETIRKAHPNWNYTQVAKAMGLSTTQYRALTATAKAERHADLAYTAKKLRDKGNTLQEIANKMGFKNDSSVRNLLNEERKVRMDTARSTADFLEKKIKEKGMIDVGTGVERGFGDFGISKEKMRQALEMLQADGYPVHGIGIPQLTNPGQQTNTKVACPPGTKWSDVYKARDEGKIQSVYDYHSDDGGKTFWAPERPSFMDSRRVYIRYAEEGGLDRDGTIQIRRGVPDLSLGNSHYAQVRIGVDGTHYMKGMAVYSDAVPPGYDIIYNTNKRRGTPPEKVFKAIKNDPDNPFGALIKKNGQYEYTDSDGKKKLSPVNKIHEEGDWDEWSHELPSQFLGKQSMSLIKKQLRLAIADKEAEYSEINSLTNPTLKKHYLKAFAEDCDKAAVDLKAAALPRQRYQVLMPLPTLKETEIYAPNYRDGETVALIRYPHGGTYEIPILRVNNKSREGRATLGINARDVIGVNKKVADRLSGADFDGDTAMVIPTGRKNRIISTPELEGLKGFDTKDAYPKVKGMSILKEDQKQRQMGIVTNLITDMTLRGATPSELAAATRHSMVIIDAVKHELNWKQSEKDNRIAALKKKYQTHYDEDGELHEGGASTLLSLAKNSKRIPQRQGQPKIDPETGEYVYKESGRTYVDRKTGKTVLATQEVPRMSTVKDAHLLSSGKPQEEAYADYANYMKGLGNRARKEYLVTPNLKMSADAKKTYAEEIRSLDAKLAKAEQNAPRERRAQVIATGESIRKRKADPDMTSKDFKKLKQQELTAARASVGAQGSARKFSITDNEWKAIQSGAISDNKLKRIINNTDADELRKRATPRTVSELTQAKVLKIQAMSNSGYTNAEIAEALGISTSTVSKNLN